MFLICSFELVTASIPAGARMSAGPVLVLELLTSAALHWELLLCSLASFWCLIVVNILVHLKVIHLHTTRLRIKFILKIFLTRNTVYWAIQTAVHCLKMLPLHMHVCTHSSICSGHAYMCAHICTFWTCMCVHIHLYMFCTCAHTHLYVLDMHVCTRKSVHFGLSFF